MTKFNKGLINGFQNSLYTNSTSEMFNYTMTNIMDSFFSSNMDISSEGKFKAVCLSGMESGDNTGAGTGPNDASGQNYISIVVRPLAPFGNILPDPRLFKDDGSEKISDIISMHASMFIARSDYKFESGDSIDFAQIVDCYFEKGSISDSSFMGLRFSKPKGKVIEVTYQQLALTQGFKTVQASFGSSDTMMLGGAGPRPTASTSSSQGVLIQDGGKVYIGSSFPDDPIRTDRKVTPNEHIRNRIIPILDGWYQQGQITRGTYGLMMAQIIQEGYKPGTRSYKYNNPGNIGNKDDGSNTSFTTLEAGLMHLKDYIGLVSTGSYRRYTIGKEIYLKPAYSEELGTTTPGYKFTYTGQIDQYIKIYATGPRQGNSYLSLIISYFNQENIASLTPESKIQDIVQIA